MENQNRLEIGEFHSRNGLTFRRLNNGTVRVRLVQGEGAPVVLAEFPASEWASVVAHLTDGGSPLAYAVAEALAGKPVR